MFFCGDMLVLLSASRMMSAGFSELARACYVCGIAGKDLDALDDLTETYLTTEETDRIISPARKALLEREKVTAAWRELRKYSLLPVEVYN
jgi:hypothetical protein